MRRDRRCFACAGPAVRLESRLHAAIGNAVVREYHDTRGPATPNSPRFIPQPSVPTPLHPGDSTVADRSRKSSVAEAAS